MSTVASIVVVVPSPQVQVQTVGGPLGTQGVPGQSAIQRVAAAAMSAGQVVRTHAAGQEMQAATTDLRTRPFDAILLGDIGSGATGNFHVAGPVPANVLQLGAGVACAVGVDASGVPVRATDPTCVSAPNWIGNCDAFGNVSLSPVRQPVFYARDFGMVADGVTPNDANMNALRMALNNSPHNVIEFDFGVYRFDAQIGGLGTDAFPFGTIFRGQGISDRFRPDPGPGPLGNKTGTVLAFFGAGVGMHLGYDINSNNGNGGAVLDLEIRGCLTTGASDYPNINEIGLQIVTDTSITVERVRVNGFKYQISLDGAETTWLRNLSFDGGTTSGYQDMTTDLGDDSACAIRIGSWLCPISGAANGIFIENCQFNSTFFGIWHKDGVGCEVRNCNYELPGAWALFHGAQQVLYSNCLGEGQTVASFLGNRDAGPSSTFGLNIINCFFDGSAPVIKLTNVAVGNLVFVGNECSNCVLFEIIQGGNLVTGPVLCEANHLPGAGPSPGALSTSSYALVGVAGTPINHYLRPQAALDVALQDYSFPLIRLRAGANVFADEGHTTTPGGIHYRLEQVYNADTGQVGCRSQRSIECTDFVAGSDTANLGATLPPSSGAGQVWITIQATRQDDQTKMGSWRIRQQYAFIGGVTSLLGSPVTEYAQDLDGSYVAPTIALSGDLLVARVQAHPTKSSGWSARVELQHVGE